MRAKSTPSNTTTSVMTLTPPVDELEPSAKRLKLDDAIENDAPATVEDHCVWLDDGNIIISAGNGPTLLFKCHRSVLSMHSRVFESMFSLPSSLVNEQYAGLPLVHLSDSPDDIRAVLEILYKPSMIPFEVCALDTIRKIGGPLRMAKKYEMDELFARLLVVLRRDWPSDYEIWQENQALLYGRVNARLRDQSQPVSVIDYSLYFPDPAPVIRLARDLDIEDVLPAAYYELYKWYPPGDGGRLYHVQGTNVTFINLAIDDSVLSREDLKHIMFSAERFTFATDRVLQNLRYNIEYTHPPGTANQEITSDDCYDAAIEWYTEACASISLADRRFASPKDPIDSLNSLLADWRGTFPPSLEKIQCRKGAWWMDSADSNYIHRDVCGHCRAQCAVTLEEGLALIWDLVTRCFVRNEL